MIDEKFNILIVALHYYDNEEKVLLRICKNGISAAHHVLLNNLIDGLNEYANVTILSSLPIGSFPQMSSKIIVRSNRHEKGCEIGYINLPVIKDKLREHTAAREIVQWYKNIQNQQKCYVIIYDAIQPFILGALKAKRQVKGITNVIMLPDLPGQFSVENNTYNRLIEYRLKRKADAFYKNVKEIDAFIPLTKHMMSAMHLEGRPYLVIECIVSEKKNYISISTRNPRSKLMYAGELSPKVNLDTLIEAVKQIDGCELYICGRGPMEKYIVNEARNTERIKYCGFVPKKDIISIEREIDIFVNPRQGNEEYTKYSFPSKNAEYLSTGKPLIAYMLSGIPEEYREFINIPIDNSVTELVNTIKSVIKEDTDVVNDRAKEQIEFIKGKSSKMQGKRIIEFLASLSDE